MVEPEIIVKLEREIEEELQEADLYWEVNPNIVEDFNSLAVDCLPPTPEDVPEEEIKPPLAIFLESSVECQEEDEEGKEHENVEWEQDPLFLGVENISIKEEDISDCVKEETVSDSDVGDIGDATVEESMQLELETQTGKNRKKRSASKENFPITRAEHHRKCPVASEGPTTRGAAYQRMFAVKARVSDHTYALSTERLCQCDVCRMCFEPRSPVSGHAHGGKPKERCGIKRRPSKCIYEDTDSRFARKGPFICHICRRHFQAKVHLTRHMLVHCYRDERNPLGHGVTKKKSKNDADEYLNSQKAGKQFTCAVCKMSFRLRVYLTQHMLVHNNGNDTEPDELCDIKKRSVKSVGEGPNTYTKRDEQTTKLTCGICKKCFEDQMHLSCHLFVHRDAGEKTNGNYCSLNKNKSENATNNRHSPQIAARKQFVCAICKVRFRLKRYLTQHVKVHHKNEEREELNDSSHTENQWKEINERPSPQTAERPFACIICKARFRLRRYLTQHMSVHCNIEEQESNDRILIENQSKEDNEHLSPQTTKFPFYCGVCKNTFRFKGLLTEHIHVNKKRKNAKECENKTMQKDLRVIEQLSCSVKAGSKPFGCNICKKTFAASGQLSGHMRAHPKGYKCDICKKTFRNRECYSVHLRTHRKETNECGVCRQEFDSIEQFYQHLCAREK